MKNKLQRHLIDLQKKGAQLYYKNHRGGKHAVEILYDRMGFNIVRHRHFKTEYKFINLKDCCFFDFSFELENTADIVGNQDNAGFIGKRLELMNAIQVFEVVKRIDVKHCPLEDILVMFIETNPDIVMQFIQESKLH